MVSFDNSGKLFIIDSIEIDGGVWIVPKWLNYQAEGTKKPERIILMPKEILQRTPDNSRYQFLATQPLPAILETAASESEIPKGYAVQFQPDLSFGIH